MNPSAPNDRLHDLANRFQKAWLANRDDPHAVDLAAFLPAAGDPLRAEVIARLIPIDLAARWQNGVPLSLEDYIQRFPEIGPLENVAPQLIVEEYRIRAEHGVVSPHSVLKQRFPNQFGAVEKLIKTDTSVFAAQTVAPTRSAVLLAAGVIVGDHYRLNHLLGRGGFGEVWHATDLRGNIDKAIKILTRSADSEDAQKELESLNIIKKINHPYLLRTESYFVEKDRLFIVLELADETMRDVLKKTQTESRTGIRVEDLLVAMKHAAEGLDFLHKQGILHRDIKPENILVVGAFGKVADFGLAKEARNKQSTQADFAGTVVYSAPETWDGRVTTWSDQYSLAATYYELRTGRVLFSGKTFQEVFLKHMEANPNLDPLPDLEQDVIRQALSKKPEDRYPSCVAFVKALESAVLASGSKVVVSHPPLAPGEGTAKKHAKTTHEAQTLASRVNADLRGDKTTPRKWNETAIAPPRRTKVWLIVLLPLAIVAAIGAFVLYDHLHNRDPLLALRPEDKPPAKPEDVKPTITPKPLPIEPKPKPPEPKLPEPKPPEVVKPKPPEPPPLSPAQRQMKEAKDLFAAGKFADSLRELKDIDLVKDADTEVKREGLALYAQLLNKGTFSRPELDALDASIVNEPTVKPAFAAAMTRQLAEDWPESPTSDAAWQQRIRDCDRADLKNPLVQAIKAESYLATKRRVDFPVLMSADEPPYVTYVRARVKVSENDYPEAAALLIKLPANAKGLVGSRRILAAAILQAAALRLTPETDGKLQLFVTVKDADLAFVWNQKALALLGNPVFDNENAFPWQEQLNAALAAAWKSEPDFARCKIVGDGVVKIAAASKSLADLALAHPAGFAKELAEARATLKAADLDQALKLGEEQRMTNPDNPALRTRQAILWYTKARILERSLAPVDDILDADTNAAMLEPENAAYRIAKARDTALFALARADRESDAAARIKICRRGLDDTATASQSNAPTAELWSDLGRLRALLHLAIGRAAEPKSLVARQALQAAIASAKQTLDSTPPEKRAELAFIMAQAYEALAYLNRVNVESNFQEAARVYEDAVLREPRYAFQRGRCLYRWANDGETKDAKTKSRLLDEAIADFKKLANLPNVPAEAGYCEALAHWDRTKRFTASPNAQKAFERSLIAASKNPAEEGIWAGPALQDLVAMTRLHTQAPDTATSWLLSVEPAVTALAKIDNLPDAATFAAAHDSYRDLFAETSAESANRSLKVKNYDMFRKHIDRAVALKHSTKHATFAVNRAIGFKMNAAALKLTPQEMTTAHEQALTALQRTDPTTREALRKELDAVWR